MVDIFVTNEIEICGLSVELKNHIKKTLTLSNPLYYRLLNMGKAEVFAVPPEYQYYQEKPNGNLLIPRGMRARLIRFLEAVKEPFEIKENFVSRPVSSLKSTITLRPYQAPLVDEILKHNEGLIVMGTGTGKTVVGIEIIARLQKSACILVQNNVLLTQWQDEIKKWLNYEAGIVNGKTKLIKSLSIATFQTLSSRPDILKELAAKASILIVDEAQGAVSDERWKIVQAFSPERLYGLTATPMRDDGQTKAIFFLFGEKLVEHKETQATPVVEVQRSKTVLFCDPTQYHRNVDSMVENNSRNTLITGITVGEIINGRKVLVLTKRVEHYEKLKENMIESSEDTDIYYISSDDPERNKTLGEMKRNERPFKAIFGTTSLLAVGTDIPALDTLVIACDIKGEVLHTQAIGRILRLFEGKPTPKIIDICDDLHPIFRNQFISRLKMYREKGWQVNGIGDWIKKPL